eukprot:3872136-Pyramimonas_sp.AAC.2
MYSVLRLPVRPPAGSYYAAARGQSRSCPPDKERGESQSREAQPCTVPSTARLREDRIVNVQHSAGGASLCFSGTIIPGFESSEKCA